METLKSHRYRPRRGLDHACCSLILGLTAQALCWHPLRGFSGCPHARMRAPLLNRAAGVFLKDALVHHLFDGDVWILGPGLAGKVAVDLEDAQVDELLWRN
jgi:hypothetical protein